MADQTFTSGQILTAAQMTTLQTNTGLCFISSTTIGSAVSSVTVSGAFSTTYDQYVITVSGGTASTSNLISMTLGATATGYYEGRPGVTLVGGAFVGNVTSNGAQFFTGQFTTTGKYMNTIVVNPFLSTETKHMSQGYNTDTTAVSLSNGWLNNTTSYTAFTLAPLAGTWTGGIVNVYGYRKA
jgi:hypothetical protein